MICRRIHIVTAYLVSGLVFGLMLHGLAHAKGWNQQLGPGVKVRSMRWNERTSRLCNAAVMELRQHGSLSDLRPLPPGNYQALNLKRSPLGRSYLLPGKMRLLRVPHTDTYFFQAQVKENGKTVNLLTGPRAGLRSWSGEVARAFQAMKAVDPKFKGSTDGVW